MNYTEAGVNIEEGYRAVEKYKRFASSTTNKAVLDGLGSFGGMFSLKDIIYATNSAEPMEDPVLVAGTDGVGTKIDLAFRFKKYDTVGIDCVAMCVNDILCHGARPLFFLDYLACGKLDAEIAAELVKGVAIGCRETGAVLLGGETAEHPGIIPDDVYDMAGFAIGIVDRKNIINGSNIREGDLLLAIASSGVHSNGFSLIRKVIPDMNEDFGGMPIGRVFLEPTRLYVKPILELMEKVDIRGMANITGGGLYENIPRILPKKTGLSTLINKEWAIPPIFARIAYGIHSAAHGSVKPVPGGAEKAGEEILANNESVKKTMFNTFNMGIGFVLALAPNDLPKAAAFLEERGFPSFEIGKVEKLPAGQAAGDLRFA